MTGTVDALGVYDLTDGLKPHKSLEFPVAPSKLVLSPNENYSAAIYPYELVVWNNESGEIIAKRPTIHSALADVEFLSDKVVIYTGENNIEAYDFIKQASLWQGEIATNIAISEDKSTIAAVYKDSEDAIVYSDEGTKLAKIMFDGKTMKVPVDDSFINPHDTLFELSDNGAYLAVSFADGSLSLFDTRASKEIVNYPNDNAFHYTGSFCGDMLVFAVVEDNPYNSIFHLINAVGESVVMYESGSSHFLPVTTSENIYFAIDTQIYSVDIKTGKVVIVASAGSQIEAFSTNGDAFLICENDGAYRFVSKDSTLVYQSDYVSNFPVLGSRFALTGGYDTKFVRILRNENHSDANVFTYDRANEFSEAKVHPKNNRAALYSYVGLTLYDLNGNIIAETAFPTPELVVNTEYDEKSGNVAVIYPSMFRLYSGVDGSLIVEAYGKENISSDDMSVIFTKFGISVLDKNGIVTLYSVEDGSVVSVKQTELLTVSALPVSDSLFTVRDGKVFFNEHEIGTGSIIGASKNDGDSYSIAISDNTSGKVFVVENNIITDQFSFGTRGRAEAYFCGDYMFLSPLHGNAFAYSMDGKVVREFKELGYLAEVVELGAAIGANYISSSNERCTYLLRRDTLETTAELPGFLGEMNPLELVFDVNGALRMQEKFSLYELISLAKERLHLIPNTD